MGKWDAALANARARGALPPEEPAKRKSADQSSRSKRGRVGEEITKNLHEACERSNTALIDRVGTPMTVVGRLDERRVICVFTEKASTDFLGIMTDGSRRAVCVETKRMPSGQGKRFYIAAMVKPHQKRRLDLYHAEGHVAVLLVQDGQIASYAVPWEVACTQKSWSRVELRPHIVPASEPDYLRRWRR